MTVPAVALALGLLPLMLGGRAASLGQVRLNGIRWVLLAMLGQVLAFAVLDGPDPVIAFVHVASYLLAGGFLWCNRQLPGMALIGLGALSNAVPITLNGGTLPALPQALRTAGLTENQEKFVNSGVLDDPALWFLGDIFAVPAGFPLANVFSVGDVLIVLGVGYASARILGTWWWRPWPGPIRVGGPRHQAQRGGPRHQARFAVAGSAG